MKVECVKENLVESIAVAEKATGRNLSLPVLSCLLLEAKNNTFVIRATNLDLGIEIEIPAKVSKQGKVAVPGNIFYNIISAIYEGNSITLEVIKNNLTITTATNKTNIKSVPHDDFPTLPILSTGESFTLNTKNLIKGLQSVWFGASTSTIKPELASVYIYTEEKKLFFVATDSFRLAEKIIPEKGIPSFDPILIPVRNIPELIRVLEYQDTEEVKVLLTSNQISFITSTIYFTSRLIDGVFPDYHQIIPKEFNTEIIVLKQDFIQTLKKVNIFSNKFNQVQFHISSKEKKFVLQAENDEVGETIESISATINGDGLDINFNHRYLSDVIQSITTDSISLSLSGPSRPMIIRGVGDLTFLYLVMPMNR